MILIESLKLRQVKGDMYRLVHLPPCEATLLDPLSQMGDVCGIEETVFSDKFRTHNGRTIEIGMTEEVREVLGLPIDCYQHLFTKTEQLEKDLNHVLDDRRDQNKRIERMRKNLDGYLNMGFWKRLQFAFRGVQS